MLSLCAAVMISNADKFEPTWESLIKFKCPEWFRDAKFGIWSHWGPQAVPMVGDWYAREMYREGTRQFKFHQATYGHQSKFGYKDIIPLWKAEKWDPEKLMKLYKAAGARYFVSMGVHHDNFDLWNSKHHRWNAVAMGPKRDVVGEWQQAAKRNGLKFGVSEHLAASFTWWQASHLSDQGEAFDGADPANRDLYHWTAAPGDTAWYSNDPKWHAEWARRIGDLVQSYKPDLLYSDGGTPFGNTGRQMIADLYNQAPGQTIYLCKDIGSGEYVEGSCVLDRERGGMAEIHHVPWQTDTSIGDWYYNKGWPYRKADWVIHTLVDVVSKNGNMLLNVVQRPDGSLDDEVIQLLTTVGEWMKVNGEAIYGTRPWMTFGEGPTKVAGGHFKEDFPFGGKDIRFTRKGNKVLYATFLGWPEQPEVLIRSLAKFRETKGKVKRVSMLGSREPLAFDHGVDGLRVTLPKSPLTKVAVTFKIECDDVAKFRPDLVPASSREAILVNGSSRLEPNAAETHGNVQVEQRGGKPNFGFWDNGKDSVDWLIDVRKAGNYSFDTEVAVAGGPAGLTLDVMRDGQTVASMPVEAKGTGSWESYVPISFGLADLTAAKYLIRVRASDPTKWKAANLRGIQMTLR